MKYVLRAAWVLVLWSVLVCATGFLMRLELAPVFLAGLYVPAFYALIPACGINLLAAIVVCIRDRQVYPRVIALTLVAALLPFFCVVFSEAAGIGRH